MPAAEKGTTDDPVIRTAPRTVTEKPRVDSVTVPAKTEAEEPEEQAGGAGDEVPAGTQALITGEGGKLSPRSISVPPFIAVKVVLESADGVEYAIGAGKRQIKAGGEIRSAAATFPGLKTGERLTLTGPDGSVVITANAEPGP